MRENYKKYINNNKPLRPKIQKQKPLNPYLKTVKRLVCIDIKYIQWYFMI